MWLIQLRSWLECQHTSFTEYETCKWWEFRMNLFYMWYKNVGFCALFYCTKTRLINIVMCACVVFYCIFFKAAVAKHLYCYHILAYKTSVHISHKMLYVLSSKSDVKQVVVCWSFKKIHILKAHSLACLFYCIKWLVVVSYMDSSTVFMLMNII